jgi:hypothetical protein
MVSKIQLWNCGSDVFPPSYMCRMFLSPKNDRCTFIFQVSVGRRDQENQIGIQQSHVLDGSSFGCCVVDGDSEMVEKD